MYLSEMRLNSTRITTRRMIGSPQVTHALVMGACSARGAPERVLWRLDRHASHDLLLYVLSAAAPDFTGVVEQAGWPTEVTWRTASYLPLLERLADDQEWTFSLTANPCRTESRPSGRGAVRPLRTVRQQREWMLERCGRIGIAIPENEIGEPQLELSDRRQVSFPRRSEREDRGGARVQLTTANYRGRLQITDADRLRAALVSGIGRAKGYGCGLMTLAP